MENNSIGQSKIEFLNLRGILEFTIVSIIEAWKKIRIKYDLVQSQLVGLAIDGDASMIDVHEGFVTKLKREVLHLFRIHCIAHRKV